MPGAPWSTAEQQQLAQLREQGLSNDAIAAALGRTRISLKHKVGSLNLPPQDNKRPWRTSELADLRSLRAAGHSFAEVAAKLGRSVHATKCKSARIGGLPAVARRPVQNDGSILVGLTMTNPQAAQRQKTAQAGGIAEQVAGPEGHQQSIYGAGGVWQARCECGARDCTRRTIAHARRDAAAHLRRIVHDAEREALITRITTELHAGIYRLPNTDEWHDRLADPEIAGRIVREICVLGKAHREQAAGVQRVGRRPGDYVNVDDLKLDLPGALLATLPLP